MPSPETVERKLLFRGEKWPCRLDAHHSPSGHSVTVSVDVDPWFRGFGSDLEEALGNLRQRLDEFDALLLINRFHRDAFTSSMSRQMSGGRQCYLVEQGRPVSPEMLVDALGPASVEDVVTAEENAERVRSWILSVQATAPG